VPGECSGDYCRVGSTGAAVSFQFEGTRVRLVSWLTPNGYIAVVTLDEAAVFNVDLYSDPAVASTPIWTSPILTPGLHSLEFLWGPYNNPASYGGAVSLDAVDVVGVLVH
jgi:hypothetical protein